MNPNRTADEARRIVARLAGFLALFVPIYLVLVLAFSGVSAGGTSLMQRFVGNPVDPGGAGHSLVRFREAARSAEVDVLVLGSSHAYRSFDPRVFRARGLEIFNMGSSNQTPLNGFHLLRRYGPQLRPDVIVIEVFYPVLENDGLESFFDLSVNSELTPEILAMAAALRHPHAWNSLVSTALGRLSRPLSEVEQRPVEAQRYWSGGYSEMLDTAAPAAPAGPRSIDPLDRQVRSLESIVELGHELGARTWIVVQPLPAAYLASLQNRTEINERLERLASETGARFVDFNGAVALDASLHFADDHHLNGPGAALFSAAVADSLLGAR